MAGNDDDGRRPNREGFKSVRRLPLRRSRSSSVGWSYFAWAIIVYQLIFFVRNPNAEQTKSCDEKIFVYSRNLTGKFGMIQSIEYGNLYPDDLRCIYYLVGEHNERVNLTFTEFDVNGVPPRCLHDYVDIYTQVTSLSQDLLTVPLHARFCGKELPDHIISMTNILVIGFYTDSSKSGTGFELKYNFMDDSRYRVGVPAAPDVCGFIIRDQPSGVFMSPTYPGMYPDNIFCFYKLHGVKGQRVRVSFHDVDLYSGGKHCPFDRIKVYDGATNVAQVIDTFCGTVKETERAPYSLYSSTEDLHIEFVTNSGRKTQVTHGEADLMNTKQTGFNATFVISSDFVDLGRITEGEHILGTECDRRIKSKTSGNGQSNGTVTSPYFPDPYPLNVRCHYYIDGLIDAQNLENVQLFITQVDIGQPKDEEGRCSHGSLMAYRLRDSWVSLLNRKDTNDPEPSGDEEFCGRLNSTSMDLRKPIVTDNPRLVLVFNSMGSDGGHRGRGFSAVYQFLTDYAIPGTPVSGERRCHFQYLSKTSNHGVFNSPRHPSNYPTKTHCFYEFRGREDELVRITFENFKIEGEIPNCTKDYLQVSKVIMMKDSDKELNTFPVAKYCGERLPGPQEEDTSNLKVMLHSDEDGTRNGFRAKYEFIKRPSPEKRCFFNITTGGGGIIELPIPPHTQHKYPTNQTCEWLITGKSPQSHIMLTFEKFHIEGNPQEKIGCGNAVLKIYTHKTQFMPSYELCGENKSILDMQIISPSNFIRLKFISSAKATGAKGFHIPWTEILPTKGGKKCSGFQCRHSNYCISSRLKCDGVRNCGIRDDSDETTQCGLAYHQHGALHIILSVVAAIIVIIIIVVFIIHRRHRGKRTKKETIQVRFLTRSVSDDQSTSGVNGGTSGGLNGPARGDNPLREKTEKVTIS